MDQCDPEVMQKVLDRLNRIEGQVRGVKKMIEEGRGCFEILKQVSAASGALRSLQKVMLEQHIQGCLEEALNKKGERQRLLGELVKNISDLSV